MTFKDLHPGERFCHFSGDGNAYTMDKPPIFVKSGYTSALMMMGGGCAHVDFDDATNVEIIAIDRVDA